MDIVGSVLFFATTAVAEAESEGGFGLNFDILETNLINLALLIGILFYFGRKVLTNILTERRSNIETAIREVEQRLSEGQAALAEAQEKLSQAQAEAQRIITTAQQNAEAARAAILAKGDEDVQRMIEGVNADINAERDRALAELRQRVVAMALENVESQLQTRVDDAAQQRLIDRSIALLGGS